MIDADRIEVALHRMALRFEQHYQLHDGYKNSGGWGQFIDGPRLQRQIGLYGTSAGLLVLSLAGRGETTFVKGAVDLLSSWWKEGTNGYGKSKFCQNSRLAFLALCLRNTQESPAAQELATEVEQELVRRASTKGKCWGDWWVEKDIQDGTPRYLATALATLCLSVLTEANEKVRPDLEKACEFLERTLVTDSHLNRTERGVIAAAIIAGCRSVKKRKMLVELRKLAHQPLSTLSENHSYIYEYQYVVSEGGTPQWNRDMIFLYAEIMIGIAGFLPNAPAALRLRSENILDRVLANMSSYDGSFRPLERVSTVEQAWCSVFLTLAKQHADHRTRGFNKIRYELLRQRPPSKFNEIVFPVSAMTIATAITALPSPVISASIAKLILSSFIYGIYGDKFIKKIFPGRQ